MATAAKVLESNLAAANFAARDINPFDTELARDNSSYLRWQDGRLVGALDPAYKAAPLAEFVHDSLRALVMNPKFSCVGAKAAFQGGGYRFGLYDEMNSAPTTAGLARDLYSFVHEQPAMDAEFVTFVASFAAPVPVDEYEWERLLWSQLQSLHEIDHAHHNWDAKVSSDPEDPGFSFSFAARGFFVVGLHPASSRFARRFAFPTMVFNFHAQFERLRAQNQFARMQQTIRARDLKLQGTLNPNLSNFGEASEARQYSGRQVEAEWKCPFHAMLRDKKDAQS